MAGCSQHIKRAARLAPARVSLRTALMALVLTVPALAVSGCAGLYDPHGFSSAMTAGNGQLQADAALAALARGDYIRAENEATVALSRDPRNAHALLAAGVAYQNSARPAQARRMYEEILTLNSPAVVSGPWWGPTPRFVSDVAADNLRALGQAAPANGSLVSLAAAPEHVVPILGLTEDAAGPAAQRFVVLARLRDEALITGEEYLRRRAANLGALLPLSEPPPGLGMNTPSPGADEVVSRLRALREAYETRNVSAAQHAAERTMILDGLLPAAPRTRAMPAVAPAGLLEAATAVGRLQRLHEMGLISAAEQARERAAIDRATRSGAAQGRATAPASAAASPRPDRKPAAPAATSGAQAATPLVPAAGTGNPAATLRSGRGPLEILPTPAPGTEDTQGDGAVLAAAQGGLILQPASAKPAPGPAPAPASPAAPDKPASAPEVAPAPTAASEAAAPTASSGAVAVHLASFRSEERARIGWTELQARHPSLKGMEMRVSQIDLPGQGTFYRLLAGPVADRAAADALCSTLKPQYCKPAFSGN
ncbi:MAG: SPOR domain-containing protein [Rhodospirillaceae bacterium]